MKKLFVMCILLAGVAAAAQNKQLESLKAARDKAVAVEQSKFDSAVKRIDQGYLKKLEQLKTSVTKKGDLDGANEIKAEIESIGGASGEAGGNLAKVSVKNASLEKLTEGGEVFGDEPKYVWDSIPKDYKGLKYWQPNGKHQALAEIEVENDGMVYIAVIERASILAKSTVLKDWKKMSKELKQTDGTKWDVYSKMCKKGETFQLQPDKYCAPIPLQ